MTTVEEAKKEALSDLGDSYATNNAIHANAPDMSAADILDTLISKVQQAERRKIILEEIGAGIPDD